MAKIKVIQRFRATRTIVLDVDDPAAVRDGEVDLPEWSDERWNENWELVDEEIEELKDEQKT